MIFTKVCVKIEIKGYLLQGIFLSFVSPAERESCAMGVWIKFIFRSKGLWRLSRDKVWLATRLVQETIYWASLTVIGKRLGSTQNGDRLDWTESHKFLSFVTKSPNIKVEPERVSQNILISGKKYVLVLTSCVSHVLNESFGLKMNVLRYGAHDGFFQLAYIKHEKKETDI